MNEREALRKALRERPDLHRILANAVAQGKLKSTDDLPDNGEELVFVCGPDHGGVTGSKQVQCACGAKVWMSPSTQELLKARGAVPTRIICMSCVRKQV